MNTVERLLALVLSLMGPGTLSDHIPPPQLAAIGTHFVELRLEAERQRDQADRAAAQRRWVAEGAEAERQARQADRADRADRAAAQRRRAAEAAEEERRRAAEEELCLSTANITEAELDQRIRELGRATQFHGGDSRIRDDETLIMLLFYEWDSKRPTCAAFDMTADPWLVEQIPYVQAVQLIAKITSHYDAKLTRFSFGDHISTSRDVSRCGDDAVACEVSNYYGGQRLPASSTIYLPDPVARRTVLHELAHSFAHVQFGRAAQHSVDWLAWQVKVLADVGALDLGERCPWFSKAGILLPNC